MGLFKRIKKRKQSQKANTNRKVPYMMEMLEPRIMLSADFEPLAAASMADGLNQLGDRIEVLLDGEDLFDTHIPFITQIQQEGDDVRKVAPTIGDLLSVEVNLDGSQDPDGNPTIEGATELALQDLDDAGNSDGTVAAGEFIRSWFFDEVEGVLTDVANDPPGTYNTAYLGVQLSDTETSLSGLDVTLTIGTIIDLSPNGLDDPGTVQIESIPVGEVAWYVPFTLTVETDLDIDLGQIHLFH